MRLDNVTRDALAALDVDKIPLTNVRRILLLTPETSDRLAAALQHQGIEVTQDRLEGY